MKIFNQILNFFIPLKCSFCGREDMLSSKVAICRKCYLLPETVLQEECIVCSSPLVNGNCEYCSSRNVFFKKLIYLRIRNPLEKNLIQRIKFKNEPYLSKLFHIGLNKKLKNIKEVTFNGIVYIPSNSSTRKRRPYHTCSSLLKSLQKKFSVPILCPLKKVSSELQSGKNYRDRFIHATHAFEVSTEYRNKLSGKYLLVDDVFTTGATVNEISKLLLMNGAEEVYLLVMTKVT